MCYLSFFQDPWIRMIAFWDLYFCFLLFSNSGGVSCDFYQEKNAPQLTDFFPWSIGCVGLSVESSLYFLFQHIFIFSSVLKLFFLFVCSFGYDNKNWRRRTHNNCWKKKETSPVFRGGTFCERSLWSNSEEGSRSTSNQDESFPDSTLLSASQWVYFTKLLSYLP